jgi:hypothetical protein
MIISIVYGVVFVKGVFWATAVIFLEGTTSGGCLGGMGETDSWLTEPQSAARKP